MSLKRQTAGEAVCLSDSQGDCFFAALRLRSACTRSAQREATRNDIALTLPDIPEFYYRCAEHFLDLFFPDPFHFERDCL
jgi:hypothetical protein